MIRKVLISLFASAAALALLFLLLAPQLGFFLIADDQLSEADVLVVLMGSIADRALEAADVYNEGYAPEILICRSFSESADILAEKGISLPDQAELTRQVLVELGVPAAVITILPGQARSTYGEALIIRDYLTGRDDVEVIILITSSYHSKRAKHVFTQVLGMLDRDIVIISRDSRYDSFQPHQWWRDRESAKRLVQEYQKLAYFYLWERFK